MLVLAIIPRTPSTEELLNKLYENAGLAGFGLLLTAIIQTCLEQLSLFEALFTLHILFFLGTGVSPMGKYHWTRSRVVMGVLLQFVSVIAFTAWGLYVWADVKNFGNSSQSAQCNDKIKYVVFFVTVRATAPWLRGIWIAGLVLSAVGLVLSFGWKAMELFEAKRMAEEQQAEETNTIAYREVAVTPGTRPHPETETAEKGWYFDISFTFLFSSIYSAVMLELTVHRNKAGNVTKRPDGTIQNIAGPGVVDVDNKWEFGQVLAVVMILASANEILHFFFGFLARRKLARKRQAQTEEIALRSEGQSAPAFYGSRPSRSNVSTRDQSTDKISTGNELQNFDKRNAEVSETIIVPNLQAQDHIGTLR